MRLLRCRFGRRAGVRRDASLRDLAESRALDLELLAGAGGLERRITNPHPQKTGLALSGFDTYLRAAACSSSARARSGTSSRCRRADRAGVAAAGLRARAALPAHHRRHRSAAGGR